MPAGDLLLTPERHSGNMPSDACVFADALKDLELSENVSIVEAAQMLGINRDTVRKLVKKGELRGYKKTVARTSPFVVDRDSVLDYDRRRRELSQPAH